MESSIKTCCLCHKEFVGYGHNPLPLFNGYYKDEIGRACEHCNITKVIPARIMFKIGTNGKNEEHLRDDEK